MYYGYFLNKRSIVKHGKYIQTHEYDVT